MDTLTDVFNSDLFSTTSLTAAVNKLPFIPGRAGKLGIFTEMGVPTTQFLVEEINGVITLVPNIARGAPPKIIDRNRRVGRSFTIPHLPTRFSIMADQVQNVRAFGSGSQAQSIAAERDRLAIIHNASLDATVEYGRIGAIKGVVYDSDGSTVIYNFFTEFGISQPTQNFVFSSGTEDVRADCVAVARAVESELGAGTYDHIHVFAGKNWMDTFVNHANVKAAYANYQEAQDKLAGDLRYTGFTFGGLVFEEYRGRVNSVDFVDSNTAQAFPVGVPNLFQTIYGPADYIETVNTPGLPRYAKAEIMEFGKGIEVEMQTNPLSICNRPGALVQLTKS